MATIDSGRRDGSGGDVPKRRRQRIVFMPNFTNPIKDSKTAESRRMVAKWAVVNRAKTRITPSAPPESPAAASARNPPPAPLTLTIPRASASVSPTSKTSSSSTSSSSSLPSSVQGLASSFAAAARATFDLLPSQDQLFEDEMDTSSNEVNSDDDDDDDDSDGSDEKNHFVLQSAYTPLPAINDPFNCMPVENTRHTQELLYSYLNAHFLTPAITEGSGGRLQRVKFYRQSMWFPLVLESKATMNALVAYMESTPGLPIKARKADFLLNHVQAAYKALRLALSNPKTEVDDSICVAVILLMLTAQRIGDMSTFQAHATGLIQLLDARSKVLKYNELIRDRKHEKWDGLVLAINGPPATDLCKFCQNSFLRPESRFSSPEPTTSLEPSQGSEKSGSPTGKAVSSNGQGRGRGFYDMVSCGHLSSDMKGFIDQILIWTTISSRLRRDKLSAGVACTHAWADERLGSRPPLDSAFFISVRLCLYLCAWLEDSHSCLIVQRMVMAATADLRNPTHDIEQLLEECPEGLVWISLILGPFVEDDMQRQWFMCLLSRARHLAAPSPFEIWYFDEAVERMRDIFIWTDTMTAGARRFWDENIWDVETATAWMADPF